MLYPVSFLNLQRNKNCPGFPTSLQFILHSPIKIIHFKRIYHYVIPLWNLSASYYHDFSVMIFGSIMSGPCSPIVSILWVSAKPFAISYPQIFQPALSFWNSHLLPPPTNLQESAHTRTNFSLEPSFKAPVSFSRRIRCSFFSATTSLYSPSLLPHLLQSSDTSFRLI